MNPKRFFCAALALAFLLAWPTGALAAEQDDELLPAAAEAVEGRAEPSCEELVEAPGGEPAEEPAEEGPAAEESVEEEPVVGDPVEGEPAEELAEGSVDMYVPTSGQLLFNPYCAVLDLNGEVTVSQIISSQETMVNNGETPVLVGVTTGVSAPEDAGFVFPDRPLDEETQGKVIFLYVEFQPVTSDGPTEWSKEYEYLANQLPAGTTCDELLVLQPGERLEYRVFGAMSKNLLDGEVWDRLDCVDLSVNFTFTPITQDELPEQQPDESELLDVEEPDDGAEPSDAEEPSDEVELPAGEEPTDAAEPTGKGEPTDAAEPSDAEEPTDEAEPSDAEEPDDGAEPSDAEELIDEAEPSDAEEPTNEAEPSDAEEPTDEAGPSDAEEPDDGAEPSDAEEPTDEAEPSDAEEPTDEAEPSAAAEPIDEAEPSDTAEPIVAEEPSAAAEPMVAAEPSVAAEPIVAAEPTVAAEPSDTPAVPSAGEASD